MQIHQLSVAKKKERKRIGRGGKRGTTAGRGSNGQKSRSGASVDPLFEGGRSTFLERLKKVRGFKSIHAKKCVVNLTELEAGYASGEEDNPEDSFSARHQNRGDWNAFQKAYSGGGH